MSTQEAKRPRVLVADDQRDVLEALRLLLKTEGFSIETASSPAGVLAAVANREFDVLLIDLNYAQDTTSGKEGLELLTSLQRLDSTLPVVVMTAWGSVDVAVEAMHRGAGDFIEKPWENARLVSILRSQAELALARRTRQRLEAENRLLRAEGEVKLVAESAAMKPVLQLIERVGPSEANVLITGENGTGKSIIAKAIHCVSQRASRTMITVNIGGLSEGVFESELFGHVRGAFTDAKADRVGRFELADQGTLFLDEIANIPLGLQPKLLRVLETGEFERVGSSTTRKVDVRVLSATNSDLHGQIESGGFRQDLFFRLNTVEIKLPPLRERHGDIPVLAREFLRRHSKKYQRDLHGFDTAALRAMESYSWPGNIRELDHAVERAVLMAQNDMVRADDLGLRPVGEAEKRLEEMSLEEAEAELIQRALSRRDGNVSQAAQDLGVSRSALYRRLDKLGIK
ncbi:MAG: sigma-54 dependent transcriptional regulator [Acidobacteriota bacterium]